MAGEYDLNLSNGSVFATLFPLETNGPNNVSTPRLIQEARPQHLVVVATPGTNTFSIVGDFSAAFPVGLIFEVVNSTSNNGTYTVQSVTFGAGNTQITTVEAFGDATPDGSIVAHVFKLVGDLSARFAAGFSFGVQNSGEIDNTYVVDPLGAYTDGNVTWIPVGNGNIRDNLLTPIALPLGEISYTILDPVSSLQLPGRGTVNYGEKLIENLIRITENFAADTSPDLNSVIGTLPTATPLVGQLWYNTTAGSEGFNVWDGSAWTPNNDLDTGSIVFKDPENANNDIYITAAEANLPGGPWPGTPEPGLVVWTEVNPANDAPIFRVLSANGDERLRVEHNTLANTGYIRSINNLELTSTGESYFHGQVGIGNDGLPTVERTLTVEGDGIAVNADAGLDARVVIDAPTGQVASVDFEVNNITHGSIGVDDSVLGNPLQISTVSPIDIFLNPGSGFVGINQSAPDAALDVVGETQLNGRTEIVASDFIVNTDNIYVDITNSWFGVNTAIGSATDVTDAMEITGNVRINSQIFASDQTAAAPTYSFTSDPDTGMFSDVADVLKFATNGTEALSISSTGLIQVPVGYEALVTADTDIPNKRYVDDAVASISWREPVRVADSAPYANVAAFPTSGIIDGVTLAVDDRVLFSSTVNTVDRDVFIWDGAAWSVDPKNPRTVGDAVYISEGSNKSKVFIFNDQDVWENFGAGSGINVQYENQTAGAGQLVFNLASVKYSINTNRLQVYMNGVKQIITLAYNETDPSTVTFVGPSPFVGGEVVEFIAFDELTAQAVAKREQQTGLVGTPLITLATMTYQVASDNLLVFVNGQKMIKDVDYTETTDSTITWIGTPLVATDVIEIYASVPIVAGTKLRDVDDVSAAVPLNGDTLVYNSTSGLWEPGSAATSPGVNFDYVTGVTGTVATTVNVTTTAKTGTNSFIQVFLNGILQREDTAGFPQTGNFFVSSTNQITFATALVPSDEVLVYTL